MTVLPACHEPPCGGHAIADADAHRAWHEQIRAGAEPPESDLTYGEVIAGWLDELDPAAIDEMVRMDVSMTEGPIEGTIAVLKKLARGETG